MEYDFSLNSKQLSGTATREIFKLLSRPEIISFAGGLPANEFLPYEDIRAITSELFESVDAKRLLQYSLTEGLPELKSQLIVYAQQLGLQSVESENVQIISGGQQGIDLVLKCFINRGDVVLVENPTYLAALQIIKSYGGIAVGVNATKDGLDIGELEQKIIDFKPKVLYCVPTFSNPSGKTYSYENRKSIAAVCAKHGVIVLEDDPYSKLSFVSEQIVPIKSFDNSGNVVFVSSFSKIISPSLRVGFCVGDKQLIRKISILKQGTDLHTPTLSQYIVQRYLQNGLLDKNLQKSLPVYLMRKEAMMQAIKEFAPEQFSYTNPKGGLFVWGGFNADIDTNEHLRAAIEQNVAYIAGSVFYADPALGKRYLRLNFSNESPKRIHEGIKRLFDLYKKILKGRV